MIALVYHHVPVNAYLKKEFMQYHGLYVCPGTENPMGGRQFMIEILTLSMYVRLYMTVFVQLNDYI